MLGGNPGATPPRPGEAGGAPRGTCTVAELDAAAVEAMVRLEVANMAGRYERNGDPLLQELAAEPSLRVVRAMRGDKLAGFTVVDRTCKPRSFVLELHVEEASRGCGLGRALLYEALDIRAVDLQVHETNTEAIGFYEHLGFCKQVLAPPTTPQAVRIWTMRRKRGVGV